MKDSEWCGDMGPLGASCFHMLTDATRDIDEPTWKMERFAQVCTKSENFKNLKISILQLCRETHTCTWQLVEALNNFDAHLDALQARLLP